MSDYHNENEDNNDKKSHRLDINRVSSRHGHKHSKHKNCLSITMFICNKQHLSNIWNSVKKKLSNTEAELKTSVAYEKSVCFKTVLKGINPGT